MYFINRNEHKNAMDFIFNLTFGLARLAHDL